MRFETLRTLRRAAGLTIYDMADRLRISPSHYSLIECGKRGLSHAMAVAICDILQKPIEEVFPRHEVDYEQTSQAMNAGSNG